MVTETDTPPHGAPPTTVWERLHQAIDLTAYRPRLREGLESNVLTTTQGEEYAIVQNPSTATYLRLPAEDFYIFQLMDGSRTVQDLVVAYVLKYRRFALQHIMQLVQDLREGELLTDRPYETYPRVRRLARPRSFASTADTFLRLYLNREFPIKGADQIFNQLYKGGAWILLTVPGLVLLAAVVVVGVPLLALDLHTAHISLTDRGVLARYALLGYVSVLTIAVIHELGHAFAVKSYGRAVRRGGVGLFYGSPCLYVDTQDMWMAPRGARIAASWAGPYSGFILAGIAGLALAVLPHGGWVTFVRAFGITALIENAFQLNPFIQYDGYYILMDWLDVYNLRCRALTFIRFDLWRKIWRREHFNREERIFAVFGVLAAAYTVFAIFLVLSFGWDHARAAIQTAIRVPNLQSLFLAALVALIMVPFAIGLLGRLFSLGRMLLRAAGRARGAARQRWYRERAILLAQIPALAKLGDERIRALAPHLREEWATAGAAIVRQGDRGDRFYLIADGRADVFVSDEAGSELVTELGPMDYFGERALLHDAPRAATVRARTKMRLLSLRARDFRASIGPYVAAHSELEVRLAELAELDRFPLLQSLAARDKEVLLGRLRPAEYAAGQTIVRQGERGDRFYLLRSGRVEVSRRDGDDAETVVQTLGPGEFFGEIALILDSPRVATVRAQEETCVWALGRQDFIELLSQYFNLGAHLAPVLRQRLTQDQLMLVTSRASSQDAPSSAGPGDPAPEFELESTAGGSVALAGCRGRMVLLWFSAEPGSADARAYAAEVEETMPLLGRRGVAIFQIVPTPVDAPAQHFEALYDAEKTAFRAYGMHGPVPVLAQSEVGRGEAWKDLVGRAVGEEDGRHAVVALQDGVVLIDSGGIIRQIVRGTVNTALPAPASLLQRLEEGRADEPAGPATSTEHAVS